MVDVLPENTQSKIVRGIHIGTPLTFDFLVRSVESVPLSKGIPFGYFFDTLKMLVD